MRPTFILSQPSYLVGQVNKIAQQRLSAVLAPHDLRLPHFAVLVALDEFGPLVQQELADVLRIDKANMVALIDHLVKLKLVRRGPAPGDRRCHSIEATATGKTLTLHLRNLTERCQREIFGVLTAAERDHLSALLGRVLRAHDAEQNIAAAFLPAPVRREHRVVKAGARI